MIHSKDRVFRYFEMEHADGTHTMIRAGSKAEAKRIYVQRGFSLADVVRVYPMPEGEDENG